jgi:hypothetical protein
MNDLPKYFGTFHDALTGVTVVRELTAEEIAHLPEPEPEPTDETPSPD